LAHSCGVKAAREAIDEALADESFGLAKRESDGMG
jgi:hypothetical protein